MSKNKRITDPQALESHLENSAATDHELAPEAQQMVQALQTWQQAPHLQPRLPFINELLQQLQSEHASARRPWFLWPTLSRLLAGGVALAAFLLFALFVTTLFRDPLAGPAAGPPPDAIPTRPSVVTMRGTAGLFNGTEFRVPAPLSEEAEELTRYVVDAAPLFATVQDVRAMALALGMDAPLVFEGQGSLEGWFARDDAGRRLVVNNNHVRFPLFYNDPTAIQSENTISSFADAASIAVQFLQDAALLPDEYVLRQQLPTADDGLWRVEVIPTLNGNPVHFVSSEVVVAPGGSVLEAHLQPLSFAPIEATDQLPSATAAFEQLLASQVTVDARRPTQLENMAHTYVPDFSAAEPGTTVTIVGLVAILHPAPDQPGDGQPLLTFRQHPEATDVIIMTGENLTGIENELFVEVSATLLEPLPGGWQRISVSHWRSLDPEAALSCLQGVLNHQGESLHFRTEEGQSYVLAYPPDAPVDVPAYLCAPFAYAAEEAPMPWIALISPAPVEKQPFDNVAPAGEWQAALQYSDIMPTILIVEWLTPGYLYRTERRENLPGQRLEPAWLFYVHSPDRSLQFVLSLPVDGDR